MTSIKKCTIYDVARVAGVSAKTVSRVINRKGGVRQSTRSRVLKTIDELGYHPHIGARSLRGKNRGCVGVTLPAPAERVPFSEDLFFWMFGEVHRVFGTRGERICFDLDPFGPSGEGDYARSVFEHLFTACIVAGPLRVDDTTIHRIHATGIPYVVAGRLDSLPECSCAAVNHEEGGYISTKHLVDRGHKRVALLQALPGFQPGVERCRGYLRALEEAGIEPEKGLVRSVIPGDRNLASVLHRLLMDCPVSAFVDASGTEDAASLREGARRAGRKLGKDLEVVVWTYTDNATVLSEASAHVWIPVREAGSQGLEELAAWYFGDKEGPVQVLYRPILSEDVSGVELAKPRHVFDMLG